LWRLGIRSRQYINHAIGSISLWVAIFTFGLRERNWLYNEAEGYAIAYSPLLVASVIVVSLLFIALSTIFIYFRF